jgi:hypothetical protein
MQASIIVSKSERMPYLIDCFHTAILAKKKAVARWCQRKGTRSMSAIGVIEDIAI